MSPLKPPIFSASTSVFQWRKLLQNGADLFYTAAEKGTDKAYKTVFATLGRQLYDCGWSTPQQCIVDEAQARGEINFNQDDQLKAGLEIVNLVAIDPLIAVINRLISSFQEVNRCRRKKQEDVASFVTRFRVLAAIHLIYDGASPS
ncbi:unnamed protein product [Agarophyton chilense]